MPTVGSILGSNLAKHISLSECGLAVFLHEPVPLSPTHVSSSSNSHQYLTVFLPEPAPLSVVVSRVQS